MITDEEAKDFIESKQLEKNKVVDEVKSEHDDLTKFRDYDKKLLPLGFTYHPNLRLELRSLSVEEVQHYSTIEEINPIDVKNKLNDVLKYCTKLSLTGQNLDYTHINLLDRMYLILIIREMSIQKGKILTKETKCTKCNHVHHVDLKRGNIVINNNSLLLNNFDPRYGAFSFETTFSDTPILIAFPTIGIQNSFDEWMLYKKHKKERINEAFIKIEPYRLGRDKISMEEIDQLENSFKEISHEEFEFLDSLIDTIKNDEKYKLGVKGLKSVCPKCGAEDHIPNIFPKRYKNIFVTENAFSAYLKK